MKEDRQEIKEETANAKQTYNWDYIFPYPLQNKCAQERIMYPTNPIG